MIPDFDDSGNLPCGVHCATWAETEARFAVDPHRRRLLTGLRAAAVSLKSAGCRVIYLDGSFVTAKEIPGDFDACWDLTGVDLPKLLLSEPVLFDFKGKRAAQKAKFGGELFPAQQQATTAGAIFLDFFQRDKQTGEPKGIIAIDLESLND